MTTDLTGGGDIIDTSPVPAPAQGRAGLPATADVLPTVGSSSPVAGRPADVPPDGAGRPEIDHPAERRALIDLLIYAWDRAKSPGVWERIAAGLAPIGVQVLRPDGEAFDPGRHEVGGIEPTDDEAKLDTIAETELAGFADRGVVIREPVVVVYRRS